MTNKQMLDMFKSLPFILVFALLYWGVNVGLVQLIGWLVGP